MNETEMNVVLSIVNKADGGCSNCVTKLVRELISSFRKDISAEQIKHFAWNSHLSERKIPLGKEIDGFYV